MTLLPPAAQAFDAIAGNFDARYGAWASVAAQRRPVRAVLCATVPPGGRILELGGGTGEDAAWLADHGYDVLLTDASPAMVEIARVKLANRARAERVAAEELPDFAASRRAAGHELFDGAFSNFAGLNCVGDLTPVGRGLAALLKPGAQAALVLFGPLPPGEIIVEILRGRPGSTLRRLNRGPVHARLGKRDFTVLYHRPAAIERAMAPWFKPVRRLGIGVFVPPSAAEPWITRHPRLLALLEWLDRHAGGPLALLGDHVLYQFVRTDLPAP